MKKKTIKKLKLNKSVITKFNTSKIKGGSARGCVGSDNCGATTGTDLCTHTTGTMGGCDTSGSCWTMIDCDIN